MNLRIRTFSMALIAMSAASQVYALPSDESENKEKKEERNVMINESYANNHLEIM
ncbi:fructan beta-(2 6)-fructosidase [Segatella copri CAG:164]|nr:fructan beta-(2 6)-fructosidase [Segatella copri CAG:164]